MDYNDKFQAWNDAADLYRALRRNNVNDFSYEECEAMIYLVEAISVEDVIKYVKVMTAWELLGEFIACDSYKFDDVLSDQYYIKCLNPEHPARRRYYLAIDQDIDCNNFEEEGE